MTMGALRDPTATGHPAAGAVVEIAGLVVTAVKTTPSKGYAVWVQDPAAPTFGGVALYYGSTVPPALTVGQTVDVTGSYVEFNGVSELESPSITIVNATPTPLDPIEIADPTTIDTGGAMAEPLEGMLVRVSGVAVTSANPDGANDYDEFEVTGTLRVDDLILDGCDPGSASATCSGVPKTFNYTVGTTFTSITGILHYSFSNTKIVPRTTGDLVSP
jgi:predicted extracellular nuclease